MIKILKTATLLLAGITLAIIGVCIGITIEKKNINPNIQCKKSTKKIFLDLELVTIRNKCLRRVARG